MLTPWLRRSSVLLTRRSLASEPPKLSSSPPPHSDGDSEDVKHLLFDLHRCPNTDRISVPRFLQSLTEQGLCDDDPRLAEILTNLKTFAPPSVCGQVFGGDLDRETFVRCLGSRVGVVQKALGRQMVVPDWSCFTAHMQELFEQARKHEDGVVANYIPQLARVDPRHWAVSVCTVDGQRASWGDAQLPFCLQSVSKPFTYSIALDELGADVVHKYVGQEPSGRLFNDICLDASNKPHNPMVNAGAIIVSALLRTGEPLSDRFDFALKLMRRFAGEKFVSFKNAVFLSERETADRNYALSYYMREHNCFPPGATLVDTLDLYFQLCSMSVTTDSLSIMAASLANGGVCPLDGDRVVCNRAVRDTLSLMLSCGMYDYSGQFAFQVGLPAKSGVSGAIMIVVPNLMGIAVYSPKLDEYGNSFRGVRFAESLVHNFNFHHYDNLLYSETGKIDPRLRRDEPKQCDVSALLWAAQNNDLATLKQLLISQKDLEACDYDGRTVLHVAASANRLEALQFVLQRWQSPPNPKDRFGRSPLDDAKQFASTECVRLLTEAEESFHSVQHCQGQAGSENGASVKPH